MPATIAGDIAGTHPLFAGVGTPEAFGGRWQVLAEKNPAQSLLRADFGSGRVATFRLATRTAPAVQGNRADLDIAAGVSGRWLGFDSHVKLEVGFAGTPTVTELAVSATLAGITLAHDPDTGEVALVSGGERVGGLPRPWLDYDVDGDPAARTRRWLDWTVNGTSLAVALPTDLSEAEWQSALLDPTVVDTTSASTATAYSNQRKIDRTSDGVLWATFWNGSTSTTASAEAWFSPDGGATWTHGASFGLFQNATAQNYVPNFSFFIDADDHAHVVWKDGYDGGVRYRRGTLNAARTGWTWSAQVNWNTGNGYNYPDVVAHREGTGWVAHLVASASGNSHAHHVPIAISSGGAFTLGAATTLSGVAVASVNSWPSIDWNHDGGGKVVKPGENPDLYVGYSGGSTVNGIRFRKATYAAGAWTWAAERVVGPGRFVNNGAFGISTLFDGTRVVIVGSPYDGAAWDLVAYERDAADTTTTTHVLLDNPAGADQIAWPSFTYDADGNIFIVGRANAVTNDELVHRKWTRSSATLGPKVQVDATGGNSPWPSVRRGHSGGRIDFVYADGTANPYTVTFDSISLDTPVAQSAVITETGTVHPGGISLDHPVAQSEQILEIGEVHPGTPNPLQVPGTQVTEVGTVAAGGADIALAGTQVTETGTVAGGVARIDRYIEIFRATARRRWDARLARRR